MRIFNTMTRRKEEFTPLHEGEARIYCCGPTVYNYFHLGNARPFVIFDVLRRFLAYRGYKVTFVQNFTDVDDKMIRGANEEGVTIKELGERYIAEYFKDADALNVSRATVYPKATEHIGEIIALVQALIDKGMAYEVDGDVYFRTEAFPGYGKLSAKYGGPGGGSPDRRGRAQAGSYGFCAVEGPKARRAGLGQPLGAGPSGLAHRVLGNEHEVPGRNL